MGVGTGGGDGVRWDGIKFGEEGADTGRAGFELLERGLAGRAGFQVGGEACPRGFGHGLGKVGGELGFGWVHERLVFRIPYFVFRTYIIRNTKYALRLVFFLKFLLGPAQQFADRGGVEVEGSGEFVVGEAAVPEEEELGVAGFEGGEGAADGLLGGGAFGGAFGGVGGVGGGVGLEGALSGGGFVFLAAAGGAEGVVAEVGGDAIEPRGEVLVRLQETGFAMQAEEDFEGEVFGLIGVACQTVEDGVDARPVGVEGGFKFRGGVCATGFHVGVRGGELHRGPCGFLHSVG